MRTNTVRGLGAVALGAALLALTSTAWAQSSSGGDAAAEAAGGLAILASGVINCVALIIGIVMLIGMWKVFEKAGKPGWAAIVPIYNLVVLTEIVGRPVWWVVLCLVPCVNVVALIIISMDVAKSYGQSAAYGIGLALLGPIFYPLLGFGPAQYVGPAAAEGTTAGF